MVFAISLRSSTERHGDFLKACFTFPPRCPAGFWIFCLWLFWVFAVLLRFILMTPRYLFHLYSHAWEWTI